MINPIQRMAFAIEHFKKSLEIWRIVIFPDESKFCIFGVRVRKWAVRDSCTALGKEDLVPTIKDGYGGAMIAIKLGLGASFRFRRENNPKHTAERLKLGLLYNVTNQMQTPSQSPDLNPIEQLRDFLGRRIRQNDISSQDMLKNHFRSFSTDGVIKLLNITL
ncbi:transposable element Tc1 transposase [Trichonephila clavipes]|nr:transposable element Tc1 transposase [Trichonephila clavipes]